MYFVACKRWRSIQWSPLSVSENRLGRKRIKAWFRCKKRMVHPSSQPK